MLEVKKVIFKNQCKNLLQDLIKEEVATSIMRTANHPLWSDLQLEQKLADLLEKSREACVSLVREINERLQDIEPECRDLTSTVKTEDTVR